MAEDNDVTNLILRQIRDEIVTTRTELKAEIAGTNVRIDDTNDRLDVTNQRLGAIEGSLKDVAGQQLMLTRYVKNTIDRHDVAI